MAEVMSYTIVTQSCITCSTPMFLSKQFDDRRQQDKKNFYCPNGHAQAYIESTEDRLRRDVARKADTIARLERENTALKQPKPKRKYVRKKK